jgi:6-phosphogluconolactonase
MKKTWKLLKLALLIAFVISVSGWLLAAGKTFVYVSNAEDGDIDGYQMNQAGELKSLGKTKAGKLVMPMAVSPNKQYLYAIVRSAPLSVVTYAIDPQTGALSRKATAPLPDSMAYVSTDATGRFLFTASYGGDKIAVSPINENGLVESPAIQVLATGKNAHSILADRSNRFVYVCNLGSNQILQYLFDAKTGKLTPNNPPLIKARPDNGPRHPAFSKDNQYLYVINELSGNVAQFAVDQKTGVLSEVDYIKSVPPDSNLLPGGAREAMAPTATSGANTQVVGGDDRPRIWAADIQVTPNGKFLYTTERTNSTLTLFSVAPGTGKLTYVASYPTETQPRGIRIDSKGRYLVASGEKSDRISVYKIDQKSGVLKSVGRYPVGHDANWVNIVDEP